MKEIHILMKENPPRKTKVKPTISQVFTNTPHSCFSECSPVLHRKYLFSWSPELRIILFNSAPWNSFCQNWPVYLWYCSLFPLKEALDQPQEQNWNTSNNPSQSQNQREKGEFNSAMGQMFMKMLLNPSGHMRTASSKQWERCSAF